MDLDPFLFVWEPLVLLLHLVCKSRNVNLASSSSSPLLLKPSRKVRYKGQKENFLFSCPSRRALLLKVPVSRTLSVASSFQSAFLHVLLAFQATRVNAVNVNVFDGAQFNALYHQFYTFVLVSRNNSLEGQSWDLRTRFDCAKLEDDVLKRKNSAGELAEEFVTRCLEQSFPDELKLFRDLRLRFCSVGFNRFKHHFPDEFKLNVNRKDKDKPMATSSNPFHCLQFLKEDE